MLLSAVMLALCACGAAFAKEAAHERRIRLATDLINKMAIEEDADALANVIKSGKGVAIFPKVTKAGLGLGGQTGEGLVLLRNKNGTWSGPAFMGINGASIGFQIGVQSVGLVLVITNQDGLRAFTGGNSFKLGGPGRARHFCGDRRTGAGLDIQLFNVEGPFRRRINRRLRDKPEPRREQGVLGQGYLRTGGAEKAREQEKDSGPRESAEQSGEEGEVTETRRPARKFTADTNGAAHAGRLLFLRFFSASRDFLPRRSISAPRCSAGISSLFR